jgi:hypothetical protein
LCRRSFVVYVERPAPAGNPAVVHDCDLRARDGLADQPRKCRRLLAVEVSLESVPDGFAELSFNKRTTTS